MGDSGGMESSYEILAPSALFFRPVESQDLSRVNELEQVRLLALDSVATPFLDSHRLILMLLLLFNLPDGTRMC